MRKLLNKPWVVALLAAAAVFFVAHSLVGKKRPVYTAASGSDEVSLDETVEPERTPAATPAEALKQLSLGDQLPDPFAPRRPRSDDAAGNEEKLPDLTETLRLAAIWQQEGEQLAFVNGRIVHAGETIGRLTLDTFERDGIWLTHWKGRDFLRLGGEFTLITPAAEAANLEIADDER